jgi:predicted nucleic-acid-binding protein
VRYGGGMHAVDTNVLVRLLTLDDEKQGAAALSLVASGKIWIAKTVLLEAHWVLRSVYDLDAERIRSAFVALLGLRNVEVEDRSSVAAALALAARGIEFSDALHLCSRPSEATFVSFDRAFVRRAQRAGVAGIERLD